MTEKDLIDLNGDIWCKTAGIPFRQCSFVATRRLIDDEWRDVINYIKDNNHPCAIYVKFGFTLGIIIHDFPQCSGVPPDVVIAIDAEQLPESYGKLDWDRQWEIFSALTHTEANIGIRRFYHMEKLHNREYYRY